MKFFVLIILTIIFTFNSCQSDKQNVHVHDTADVTVEIEEIVDETNDIYEAEKTVSVEFVNNNDYISIGITDEMNEIIKKYFIRYYTALGDFSDLTFNDMYYFDTEYECGIANAMVAYQNRIRTAMSIDFGYNKALVGVSYISVDEVDGNIRIYLTQNESMNFNFIPDITSYTSDVEHEFIIKDISGEYFIIKHSEISGAYSRITEAYDTYLSENNLTLAAMTTEQIRSSLDELNILLTDSIVNELKKADIERNNFNSNKANYETSLVADNPYNVDDALEYSYKWIGKNSHLRNPAFTEYDIYGGNCNNFTSQCLLAGGIPMDLYGEQWKWYGEDINNSGGRYGRSSSWAACEYFFDYCKENTGFGLVCDTECNLYSGKPGDIIQYVSDGIGVHSVIISKVITDQNGDVIEYLVNSNTTDKIDSPMSLYGYTDFRLLRIIGYND